MAFEVYSGEMYNEEIKKQFLERYEEESTRNVYARIFYHSHLIEEGYGKDLYDFNIEEINDLMRSLNPLTKASARTSASMIRTYIDWAISRRQNNLNPLDLVDSEWYESFLDDADSLYFTKDQIDEILSQCRNYQDAVIISLLFEGVSGKEVSELRNLKITDVNQNTNELTLHNNKKDEARTIKVSDQCIKFIMGAYNQKDYLKGNGDLDPDKKVYKPTHDLIETGYIIKAAKTRTETIGAVTAHLIYQRLIGLSKYFDMPHLSKVKSIQQSGMIWMAKKLIERDGELGKEQYIEICKHYNYATRKSANGDTEYIWGRLKEIVSRDLVDKMYIRRITH